MAIPQAVNLALCHRLLDLGHAISAVLGKMLLACLLTYCLDALCCIRAKHFIGIGIAVTVKCYHRLVCLGHDCYQRRGSSLIADLAYFLDGVNMFAVMVTILVIFTSALVAMCAVVVSHFIRCNAFSIARYEVAQAFAALI